MTNQSKTYSGRSVDVGANIAFDRLYPVIQKAREEGKTEDHIKGFLMGVALFAAGIAGAEISQEFAKQMMDDCAALLKQNPPCKIANGIK